MIISPPLEWAEWELVGPLDSLQPVHRLGQGVMSENVKKNAIQPPTHEDQWPQYSVCIAIYWEVQLLIVLIALQILFGGFFRKQGGGGSLWIPFVAVSFDIFVDI